MRILIRPGGLEWTNLGDVAMAQVAVKRLAALWPQARVDVITRSAERLAAFCPGTFPVPAAGQAGWLSEGSVFGGRLYSALIPRRLRIPAGRAEAYFRRRWPRLAHSAVRVGELRRPLQQRTLTAFSRALLQADLFVVSGAGDINSAFEPQAEMLLDLIELAKTLGVPTLLFGQGVGPVQSERLRARASKVLPHVDFIGVRESRRGVALLTEMGVDARRVMVTGDDALELAYDARMPQSDNRIGVNVRRAAYAEVDDAQLEELRPVLREAAVRHGTHLMPLPVRLTGFDSDVQALDRLLAPDLVDRSLDQVASPLDLVRRIGRCRLVVTGSYHAAVFALAQGIPAVALARSDYYVDKFLGLADQFQGGCELVDLGTPNVSGRLAAAVDRAWAQADDLRPRLRAAAARQIAAGRQAYERAREFAPAI